MVTQMTNRLLATVMAFAVSTGLVAHAAQDKQHPLPSKLAQIYVQEVSQPKANATTGRPKAVTLPPTTSVPQAVQSAANHLGDAGAAVVDPSAAIRAAFQRDLLALEHLRQQASRLTPQARKAFNQGISYRELQLVEMEKTALASRSRASATIGAMDELVTSAKLESARMLTQARDGQRDDHNHQSEN